MNVSPEGRIDLSVVKFVSSEQVDREERLLRSGDVVFNNTNSPELVGKTAVYSFEEPRAFSNHMTRVRFHEEIDPTFFAHYLHQQWRTRYFESVCNNHVSQASVSSGVLQETQVCIPPVAEQRRIVAKVEELLAQVNAARGRLAKLPTILKRFRQAVLAAACDGRLTADWREAEKVESFEALLTRRFPSSGGAKTRRGVPDNVALPELLEGTVVPETWKIASVAEMLRRGALVDVKDGNHGANHPKVSDFTEKGTPFITAAQVNGFKIDYETAYKVSGKPLADLRVGFAKPGDAVLTHKGSVGRSALNTESCVLTPQTTYYRCAHGVIDASYLVYLFASPQFFGQLAQVMSQTTRDFVPISEQYYLHLILPPPSEQAEIVRRVDALFALADKIEARVQAATERVEKVTQAILAKAFRGELVPTEAELARQEGRGYEPASVLLERIRASRPETNAKPRRRRTTLGKKSG
jgi:type I restriction enzyme S subunit